MCSDFCRTSICVGLEISIYLLVSLIVSFGLEIESDMKVSISVAMGDIWVLQMIRGQLGKNSFSILSRRDMKQPNRTLAAEKGHHIGSMYADGLFS